MKNCHDYAMTDDYNKIRKGQLLIDCGCASVYHVAINSRGAGCNNSTLETTCVVFKRINTFLLET